MEPLGKGKKNPQEQKINQKMKILPLPIAKTNTYDYTLEAMHLHFNIKQHNMADSILPKDSSIYP